MIQSLELIVSTSFLAEYAQPGKIQKTKERGR
jgi:hypothetical protein